MLYLFSNDAATIQALQPKTHGMSQWTERLQCSEDQGSTTK